MVGRVEKMAIEGKVYCWKEVGLMKWAGVLCVG